MQSINYLIFLTILSAAVITYIRGIKRCSHDVLDDLDIDFDADLRAKVNAYFPKSRLERADTLTDLDAIELGLLDRESRRLFRVRRVVFPLFIASMSTLIAMLTGSPSPKTLCILAVAGWGAGTIIFSSYVKAKRTSYLKRIEFYLPLVMERIVMAVQAGLDVIPAIQVVLTEPMKKADQTEDKLVLDPVSYLLESAVRLTERGIGFERALNEVAGRIKSSALRHAFVHLGLAQRDGGELVVPLRELSDSTQLYYQESVEEEIARMPVKATMPLLFTFAGLIICFITSPIIQIITITKSAMPN